MELRSLGKAYIFSNFFSCRPTFLSPTYMNTISLPWCVEKIKARTPVSYAHGVPDGRECFFVFSRSANENADRVLKSWISDLLQVRWWEAAVGHSFSWRPFVPRHGPVSRQTSGSSKSRFAGRPDDPLTPRYVFSLDLTNVAIVSCDAAQALWCPPFEQRGGISVNQLA